MYSKKHRGCHRNHAVLHGRHGIGMDRGMEQFRRQKEVCSGGYDWVELYNATDNGISLSGYHLQDDKGSEEEYTFSADETIAAGGFYVITEDMFPFGISGNGETITLCDEAYAVIDQITVPAMDDYYTYARTDDGGNSWETVAGGTRGRSNSGTPDSIPGDNTGEKPSDVDYTGLKLNEEYISSRTTRTRAPCRKERQSQRTDSLPSGRRKPTTSRRMPSSLNSACRRTNP